MASATTRARLEELERRSEMPERFGELNPVTLQWLAYLRDEGPRPEVEPGPMAEISAFSLETQALVRELRGP